MDLTAEDRRLDDHRRRRANWKKWGPYLSERGWGTVREDYSASGDAWSYFPHAHARSRAYRWGEDGLLGICDRQGRLCFSPALWNGKDAFLKERLFGLSGPEGNHGEDVKECYYYLDATPTHSYTKGLYKYPHGEYPYRELVEENRGRDKTLGEVELADLGYFKDNAYFDVLQEVAKRTPNDLLWRITITNHGAETAPIHVLPTIWFRNVWTWGCNAAECKLRPRMQLDQESGALQVGLIVIFPLQRAPVLLHHRQRRSSPPRPAQHTSLVEDQRVEQVAVTVTHIARFSVELRRAFVVAS